MKPIEVFGRYAMAFEEVVRRDNWAILEEFFTEDAVYETIGPAPFAGIHEGRDAVFAHLKESLDTFDRRFDSRENAEMVQGPRSTDDSVWLRWRVTYRIEGAPPFVLEGEETAVMEGNRIRRLEDRFTAETAAELEAWMTEHGDKLKPVGTA